MRRLGLLDCSRIMAALEEYAEDLYDDTDEADNYRALADEIADAALVLIVPAADPPERAAGILARHSAPPAGK